MDEDLDEEIEENSEISEKGNSSTTAYEIAAKTSTHSSKKSTQKSSSASIKANNRRSNTSGSRDASCKDIQQNYSITLPDSTSLLNNKEYTEGMNKFLFIISFTNCRFLKSLCIASYIFGRYSDTSFLFIFNESREK